MDDFKVYIEILKEVNDINMIMYLEYSDAVNRWLTQ